MRVVVIVHHFTENIWQERIVEAKVDRHIVDDLLHWVLRSIGPVAAQLLLLPHQGMHDTVCREEHAVHGGEPALLRALLPVVWLLMHLARGALQAAVGGVGHQARQRRSSAPSRAAWPVEVGDQLGDGGEAVLALRGLREGRPAVVRRAVLQAREPPPGDLARLDDEPAGIHQQRVYVVQPDDVEKVDLECAHTAQWRAVRTAWR
mmetsp:Transcript_5124/g.14635  ORF Transcript_5124/g.14635 Transcript_5124/m.14635 type:complete len:205 (+) Transcript_5124:2312-2926(+)